VTGALLIGVLALEVPTAQLAVLKTKWMRG